MITDTSCDIRLGDWGTILGSRALGADVRTVLSGALDACDRVIVSFDGVEVVSSSFADEAVAHLLVDLGPENFRRRVRLAGASEPVRAVVNAALGTRQRMICCA